MSRNGSGTFSTVNTFLAGAVITAAGHNQNWADAATEFTNSVAADGQTPMTEPLRHSNGTLALPAVTFVSDTNTGMYRKGADNLGIVVGGVEAIDVSTSGVDILGTTTNDSADAGFVGEYIEASLASPGNLLASSGTINVATISLTPGDWDVQGWITTTGQGTTSQTTVNVGVSIVSQTFGSDGTSNALTTPAQVGVQQSMSTPIVRFSLAATTTVYLLAFSVHTVANPRVYGHIRARRIR